MDSASALGCSTDTPRRVYPMPTSAVRVRHCWIERDPSLSARIRAALNNHATAAAIMRIIHRDTTSPANCVSTGAALLTKGALTANRSVASPSTTIA
jgi:hypothetical protein